MLNNGNVDGNRFANMEASEAYSEFDREFHEYQKGNVKHMIENEQHPLLKELDDTLLDVLTVKKLDKNGRSKGRTLRAVSSRTIAKSPEKESNDCNLNLRYFLFAKMLANVANNPEAKIVSPENFDIIARGAKCY